MVGLSGESTSFCRVITKYLSWPGVSGGKKNLGYYRPRESGSAFFYMRRLICYSSRKGLRNGGPSGGGSSDFIHTIKKKKSPGHNHRRRISDVWRFQQGNEIARLLTPSEGEKREPR